jgi:hypothetical protein
VKTALITARRPSDVAREVEVMLKAGYKKFVLRSLANGEMLDRERLGAARYVAGLQAGVELDGQASSGAPTAPLAGAGSR